MVFELLGARMRNSFHIQAFLRLRLKKLLRKVERDEHAIAELEKNLDQYLDGGVIEETQSRVHELIGKHSKTERNIERIFTFEEQTIVSIYSEFMNFYKGMQDIEKLEKEIAHEYSHFSQPTQQRLQKVVRQIIQVLKKNTEETYNILLQLARSFRDQYEALQKTADGKQAQERLRDMVYGSVFQKLTEQLNLRNSRKAAKHLKKDIKQEEKEIDELEHMLKDMKSMNEEKFVQALEKLEKLIEDETQNLEQYLKNTRVFLLIMVKHYFISLSQILKAKEAELTLESEHFPQKALAELLNMTEIEIQRLSKDGEGVMRESYQLYNKMKALKEEVNSLQKAA